MILSVCVCLIPFSTIATKMTRIPEIIGVRVIMMLYPPEQKPGWVVLNDIHEILIRLEY